MLEKTLYNQFCQVFGVSAEASTFDASFRLSGNNLFLNASPFKLNDHRALALSCALLTSAHIPRNLVHEFVHAYVKSSKDTGFCSTVLIALARNKLNLTASEINPDLPVLHYSRWRFSGSSFTGHGAALLIATAVVLSNGALEVDMSSCPNVYTIEISPYADVVQKMRFSTGVVKFGLRGLRLDMCPLRSFGRRPESVLYGLQWLSFRQTRVRNLWSVASLLKELRTLRAVFISGNAKAMDDIRHVRSYLDDTDHAENLPSKRKSAFRQELSESDGKGTDSSGDCDSSDCRTADRVMPIAPESKVLPTLKEYSHPVIPYLAPTEYRGLEDYRETISSCHFQTPVSSNRHYRPFLLVHSRPALTSLDGVTLTSREVENARRTVMLNFDISLHGADKPSAPILSVLRNREIGMAQTQFVQGKPSYRLESTPKRRRNSHYGSQGCISRAASSDFGSAIHGSTRSNSESVNSRIILPQSSQSSLGTASRTPTNNSDVGSDGVSSEPRFMPVVLECMRSERVALTESGFNHRCFEGACTEELLERPGIPRVEYLCDPSDRPRQFEYNRIDTRLLVYGTEHANLVVLNQDTKSVYGSCRVGGGPGHLVPGQSVKNSIRELPQLRPGEVDDSGGYRHRRSVLGLSWFNKDPNFFIAGSENGSIHIYNVDWMRTGTRGGCVREAHPFQNLTSLHTNSEDDRFLVSGYSTHVGLFDLATGAQLEVIRSCHQNHINVLKFAHHDPNVFVTSSFDHYVKKWDLRERRPGGTRRPIFECKSASGNVMVCFSPDDKYFLVSGEDNDVVQYYASDGRLDRAFEVPKRTELNNYTRSYYMNGRDYIISGSCAEDVVRIYNARTGSLFKEVDLDSRSGSRNGTAFVQSLRSNPRRRYTFSALMSSDAEEPCNILADISLLERE